ncbi:MAG: permease-like cell division protein FtsX [Bacteroidaceae bacterium]
MSKDRTKSDHKNWVTWQDVANTMSIMMVLVVLGVGCVFLIGSDTLSTYVKEHITFSILLSDKTTPTKALELQNKISTYPFVKLATYISKDEALKEQSESMGADPSEFLGYNPYRASIEVNLNAVYANTDSLNVIKKELSQETNIEELVYQKDLINKVNHHLYVISLWLLGIAALFSLISFVLINNMIRLSMYSKRFVIHTQKLVGASWGFIRTPFITRHVISGLFAGIFANIVLLLLGKWMLDIQPDLIVLISKQLLVLVALIMIGSGVLITFLCALFSINRYLKMKSDSLYFV